MGKRKDEILERIMNHAVSKGKLKHEKVAKKHKGKLKVKKAKKKGRAE